MFGLFTLKNRKSSCLGLYSTVFQAEIKAITACVEENITLGYGNISITIVAGYGKGKNNIKARPQYHGSKQ